MRTPSQRTERALLLVDARKQDALWEDGRHHNRLPSTGEDTAYNHQGDTLDVHFASPAPGERHARVSGHPVPIALVSWIPAFAGMTRGHKHWQCIYEMDI